MGKTFGMCVLQDFEALTPNLLARTIETVEGGGIVVLLLKTMTSLKQLYTLAMDVHSRFRTESHQHVVGRFNERFILSLTKCDACIIADDELNVLPITAGIRSLAPVDRLDAERAAAAGDEELRQLRAALEGHEPAHSLLGIAKTPQQATVLLQLIDAIQAKTLRRTVSLTAARGRGKSATLGMALGAAIAFGYANIFVTSPHPDNLQTLFQFIFKSLDALGFEERADYEIVQSTNPDFNNAVVRINVFREHRQTIQYIDPQDSARLAQAELLVVDEAAAVPLPWLRRLFGPYLVFLATTTGGYEGTGRALELKLLKELRASAAAAAAAAAATAAADGSSTASTTATTTRRRRRRRRRRALVVAARCKRWCSRRRFATPPMTQSNGG
jgi:N-acetyltransferase 10